MLLVSGPPGIDLNKKIIIQLFFSNSLFDPCCFASKHLSQHKDRHKKKRCTKLRPSASSTRNASIITAGGIELQGLFVMTSFLDYIHLHTQHLSQQNTFAYHIDADTLTLASLSPIEKVKNLNFRLISMCCIIFKKKKISKQRESLMIRSRYKSRAIQMSLQTYGTYVYRRNRLLLRLNNRSVSECVNRHVETDGDANETSRVKRYNTEPLWQTSLFIE